MKYSLKYKRPTEREHGHKQIITESTFIDGWGRERKKGSVIGYYMKDTSPYTRVDENWFLEWKFARSVAFRTQKELLAYLDSFDVEKDIFKPDLTKGFKNEKI